MYRSQCHLKYNLFIIVSEEHDKGPLTPREKRKRMLDQHQPLFDACDELRNSLLHQGIQVKVNYSRSVMTDLNKAVTKHCL